MNETKMNIWQQNLILGYLLFNLFVLIRSFFEISKRKNPYGLTKELFFIGSFVWGDAVVFSLFWILLSGVSLGLNNWYFFWFSVSVFWVIRSFGEVVYWLNQQFSKINRNPIENLLFNTIFKDDSLWFIYQTVWQCVMVVAIIGSVYFGVFWIRGL